jgi:hypothetical protein
MIADFQVDDEPFAQDLKSDASLEKLQKVMEFPLMVQNRKANPSRKGISSGSDKSHHRSEHMGSDGK